MGALTDIAGNGTIPRMALAASEAYRGGNAIEEGDFVLRYDELAEAMLRSARAFVAAGIEPGDRVAVWAPNVHEWILAALGLQSAGAVLVPLNTRFKGSEAAYILNRSGARMLCTVGEFLGTNYVELVRREETPGIERVVALRGEAEGVESWADFLAQGADIDEQRVRDRIGAADARSLSDMMFTSGTTGKPKGVMTEHQQNLRVFEAWSEVIGLREGDRYLIINPFFHSFGYKAGWMASLMRGATILPQAVFDVDEVLSRVASDRVSMLPGPPAIYQSILAHPRLAEYDIGNLRLAVTGAAAIPVELIHRMRDELGFETIVTGYGLTETCGTVSMCRHDDDPETIATTSGRAIEGIEVRCIDSDGKEVPPDEPGEVVVRGYNLMRGYFDDEAATRETIDEDGWLHTGDIAIMDARGYLRITDRIKDMFIMGGFNCYPAEVENALFEMPGIAAAAVIGVPDERMGEVGMAFVVLEPGASHDEAAIIEWSRANMANYKVPRHVRMVDELPMNASGKVTKFALRDQARAEGLAP